MELDNQQKEESRGVAPPFVAGLKKVELKGKLIGAETRKEADELNTTILPEY